MLLLCHSYHPAHFTLYEHMLASFSAFLDRYQVPGDQVFLFVLFASFFTRGPRAPAYSALIPLLRV
eukprot:TRINITY_DN1599_c0_g1_i1.p1 TRINITY_DN1599_c0_g1~~TRINITY_DN1599_c0_g1_i1.p1  ORF type:complete len:66 (+),score=32.19 TRINITY_DN1599_c0_g1_i1:259-456(+)